MLGLLSAYAAPLRLIKLSSCNFRFYLFSTHVLNSLALGPSAEKKCTTRPSMFSENVTMIEVERMRFSLCVSSVASRAQGGVPTLLEAVALAVHLKDVNAVSEAVQQCAGEPLRAEYLGPLVEGQVGGHQKWTSLAALAKGLQEEFGAGLGEWDAVISCGADVIARHATCRMGAPRGVRDTTASRGRSRP